MPKYSKRLPKSRNFDGHMYAPAYISYSKADAERRAAHIRKDGNGHLVRVTQWPKSVSTEDYGEGPGFGPTHIVWIRKNPRVKR